MKIAILTQPLHYNYGGVLQNWALQQVLTHLGHEPETIALHYSCVRTPKQVFLRTLSLFKTVLHKCLFVRSERKIHNPFGRRYSVGAFTCDDNFISHKIKSSPLLFCHKALLSLVKRRQYDAFLVGSDQVWREEYSPRIETFFLDFLANNDCRKRIAYAASFGLEQDYISEEKLPLCKRLLQRFDAVSVREDGGLRIAREEFGRKDAIKVLDPTLLLNSEDYLRLIKPKDRNCGNAYVAAYILDDNKDKHKIVDSVSKARGKDVRTMSASFIGRDMPTISQWLANIAFADFVITDSFHGCVFSIIFRKPFIAIGNKLRGLDRFTSLLNEFGLSNRLILNYSDFQKNSASLTSAIDFTAVHNKLGSMRQHSLNFLTNALAQS